MACGCGCVDGSGCGGEGAKLLGLSGVGAFSLPIQYVNPSYPGWPQNPDANTYPSSLPVQASSGMDGWFQGMMPAIVVGVVGLFLFTRR